ncbi:hypothetical protein EHQ59_03905 [Leptospira kemamanensis]|uniref:Uncharacterized protein n=1 Tax=Leptospira kemamanensis TaxID=2484942 RepID=A0A4R9JS99_9LEPT|nr:hypothetical protein [Leptospira kemamanensis]TGL55561.1 hypothetical protein EHQ59_03905 [Leptospira kemamanensis]
MKRKASLGFILLFLLYLGCKSSLFGVCLSADSFVQTKSVPPCHQTETGEAKEKESCDCPIVLESLQFSSDSTTTIGKPGVTMVTWLPTSNAHVSFRSFSNGSNRFFLSQTALPPYLPMLTIRLLI